MTRAEVLMTPRLTEEQAPSSGRCIGYGAYRYNRHGTTYCGHHHRSLVRAAACRRKLADCFDAGETGIWAVWETVHPRENDLLLWRQEVSPEEVENALVHRG